MKDLNISRKTILIRPPIHLGGLESILDSFNVKNLIIPEFSDINLYGEVDKNGTNLVKLQQGDQFKVGDVVINVLSPSKKYENNNSVLCKLTYKDFSMLLTRDIEKEVEELVLKEGVDLDRDVLKVVHHGSDTSSTEEFIKAVLPEVAVVSVGKNNFGHPSFGSF
ncbi:MAG: hypothetical protein ABF289_07280 [Clostridiales bacterium]